MLNILKSLILLVSLAVPLSAATMTAQEQSVLSLGIPQYAAGAITGSTTEANARIILANGGAISALRARAGSTLPLLSSVTITVFLNGAPTLCTCTITPADGTNQVADFLHPFVYNAGDTLSFQFVSAGLGVANTITASVNY